MPPAAAQHSDADGRLLARDDVVVVRGRYALRNTTLTPAHAAQADLLFVRRLLDDAGIEHLLVRGDGDRPVLAVAWSQRKALRKALRAGCADEPFYARGTGPRRGPMVLVADGRLAALLARRVVRLHRPRVDPDSGLYYGGALAVQIELWSYEEQEIALPVFNALTRRSIDPAELILTTVERHGLTWTTIDGMFAAQAGDLPFEIDLVFSWVDGSDDVWQKARAARMSSYVVGAGDDSVARFRHVDELRYALRSVHMFAPWVRRIFVATDSPKPAWLADHPAVTFVRSEEFFADPSVLPVHNSLAVESQLHRIEGLAEHFVYANDDMFFGRPVRPEMFFSPGGVSQFIEAPTRIGLGTNDVTRSGHENSARVNRTLLQERFGQMIVRHLDHAPTPLRRSVIARMEQEFAEDFARTAASRFRSSTDVSVTNSLYHYYALMSGLAVVQRSARTKYVDTTSRAGLADMTALLAERSVDFFCLNDGSEPEIEPEDRARAVTDFMTRYFPIAAPWEQQTNEL